MGAPLRLAVPWKYGFKSIKSIVRFSFTDQRPKSFWEALQASEYGFWANVNPEVPHPRWSQATEEDIGTKQRRPTLAVQRLRRIRRRSLQGTGEGAALGVRSTSFADNSRRRIAISRTPHAKKKPGPCGPGCSLAGTKSAITFQRGTAGCIAIATWEEQRPVAYSATEYEPRRACEQRGWPHVSHASVARGDSSNRIFRNSTAALSRPGSRGTPGCARPI